MRYAAVVLLAALTALAACQADTSADDPPDLRAYLAEIRAAGMTERARSHIHTVAGVLTGQTTLTYTKDQASGAYWGSYRSNTCAVPGTPAEEQARLDEERAAARDRYVRRIVPVADTDGSGFVSTREGTAFREMFDFGAKASQVVAAEAGDRDAICAGLNVAPDRLDARLAAYAEFARRAAELGFDDCAAVEPAP